MTNSLSDLGWSAHFMMQVDEDELKRLTPARITRVHRATIEALTPEGAVTLRTMPKDSTGDFAVGDWVLANENGQIERTLDRVTVLKRRAAGSETQFQLIGANIDILFITTSCNRDFNIARLERYLILAHGAGIQPVALLTKADLAPDPGAFEAQAHALDATLPVLLMDARDKTQVTPIFEWWREGQTAALLGSSGVGKTTLLNTLTEASHLTAGLREDDVKGRHTTTSRGLYAVAGGRWVIDTPGMRELGLFDVADGVEAVFADLMELAASCRFSDCQHQEEPDCAVKAAIASGELDADRFNRWQKLEHEDAHNNRSIAETRKHNRDWGRHMKSTVARRKALKGD